MQDSLFPDDTPPEPPPRPRRNTPPAAGPDSDKTPAAPATRRARDSGTVQPMPATPQQQALAGRLPPSLHMGTSSWHFPGWDGLVWQGAYAEKRLSSQGLKAYGQHALLRSVSLDRAFYRPLSTLQYIEYAEQVPETFRFVVKAPALVTDSLVRGEQGQGKQDNPGFLDPRLAVDTFVRPAIEGLGTKAGALVFQISPLPSHWLRAMPVVLERLSLMLEAVRDALDGEQALRSQAPDVVIAVEVRDAAFLRADIQPRLAEVLLQHGATYCLGLHAKMPPIEAQLPLLRRLWPGPLVCRWNLHRKHGAYGYQAAKDLYEPFDRIQDADPETRSHLTRVILATAARGLPALVTINNKVEGSAPLSVEALAQEVAAGLQAADTLSPR